MGRGPLTVGLAKSDSVAFTCKLLITLDGGDAMRGWEFHGKVEGRHNCL